MNKTGKLQLKLLGHFQVIYGTVTLTPRLRPRAQRLLAYLLLHRRAPRHRDNIAFTLWPDYSEKEALGALRRGLSELRTNLPALPEQEWITVAHGTLCWASDAPYWLDLETFEQALSQATLAAFQNAVSLYEGDLLADWDEEWLLLEREQVRQTQFNTLRQLTLHHWASSDYKTALNFARQALTLDPLAEAPFRDLIALHYVAGDRPAALAEYERLESLLWAELGVEPMAETQALRAAIVQGQSLPAPASPIISPPPAISTAQTRPQPIGRDIEMAKLNRLWANTIHDQGSLAIISGEAGVGKSHLVLSFVDYTIQQGGLALIGHCYEYERALPYQALVEMLRSAVNLPFNNLPVPHQVALARLVPDILGVKSELEKGARVSPDDLRAQLFEALLQAFLALARSQSLLLLFEDVHWAAESTLDWLTYITPRLSASRLLVVITYRTNEVGAEHALARLERHFARQSTVSTLSLKPLSRESNREWVAQLSGLPEPAAIPVADRLLAETAGNPFFLEEVVRGLIEVGQITLHEGRWTGRFVEAASNAAVPLPESLRATIKARLERLTEMARIFIRTAAVAGRVFEYELVRQAENWAEALALEALEELLGRGFIRPDELNGGFAFTHHLVQECIYADLTAPRRAYLHRRLAEAIQRLHPQDFEALAYHFAQAGDETQARLYYLQAGDHAQKLLALSDAAEHYQAALERWPEADLAGRAEILYKLGQCQWVIMELQKALASFEAARALFQACGDRIQAGDMERMIGRMHWELGDAGAAWRHYRQALAILEEGPETVELARAISSISQMYMLASQYEEAIVWGERALRLAEQFGAEEVIVHVLNNVGTARMTVYDYNPEQGLSMLRESVQRARVLGLPHDVGRAYVNLGDSLLGLSRYAEAQIVYEELLAYATPINARAFLGAAGLLITVIDWLQGRWQAALSRKPHIVQPTKGPWKVWAATRYAWLENDLGRAEVAYSLLEPLLAKALQWDEMQTTVPYLGQLARAYTILGMETEASSVIQRFLELIDRSPTLHSDCIMPLLIACRRYAARPQQLEAARACLPRLERAQGQYRSLESEASLAEGRGAVALAEGYALLAAEQFQRAAAQWAAMERPYDQARALGQLGVALTSTGEAASAEAAFAEALEIINSLAGQLDQAELRQRYLNSPLVQEIQTYRGNLETWFLGC